MPYITILGAGSAVFARQLMTDILQIEGLDEGCFALVDIDAHAWNWRVRSQNV